ncbi:substrate-binding domain-containing protein [Roseicyclus persicicus]|uniref:ABC transporter substrate-binding protein n=1 Tax=Roseicyclus persicicus TaxID=2650661 RepID=A0A7X6H1E2_9RHOB|nr:ABC transporter substrate-binding protein [Roseibacterium persicicum]
MTVACLCPVALTGTLPALVEMHTRATGVAVELIPLLNPEVPRRIAAGADYDVALTNPVYVRALVALGRADPASHRPFGRVPLAIATSDAAAGTLAGLAGDLATLLRAAAAIAYTADGTSGQMFRDMALRLGVLAEIEDRLMPMAAGEPIRAAARGDCTLAAAPLTTVRATAGVTALAVCPPDLGTDIDMSVFLSPEAAARPAARAFLDHLTDPGLDGVLADRGVGRFAFPG